MSEIKFNQLFCMVNYGGPERIDINLTTTKAQFQATMRKIPERFDCGFAKHVVNNTYT